MAVTIARGYIQIDQNIADEMRRISSGLDSVQARLRRFSSDAITDLAKVYVSFQAIKTVGMELAAMFKGGLILNMETESARNGLAGILTTVYDIKDATGKSLIGADAFQEALIVSEKMMKQIKINAINTAASSKEILDAVLQGTAPGATAGLNTTQIVDISTLVANIAKTQNMAEGQVGQELRALLTGKIDKTAAIGTQLGFGPGGALQDEYKKALDGGKIYDFLIEKMGTFSLAAQEQAKTLAGVWDAAKESFSIFKMEISKGLAKELSAINSDLEEVFDKKLGTFTDKFQPLINVFNSIGKYIGSEIAGAFDTILNKAAEFGQEVEKDNSFINGMIEAWEQVKNIAGTIIGIFTDIWTQITEIANVFITQLNPSVNDSNEGLTGMQTNTQILIGFVSSLATMFAFVRDIVTDIVGALRLIAGNGITAISNLGQYANTAMAKIYDFTGNKDKADKYRALNKELEDYKSFGDKLAFQNNKLMENFSKDGFAGLFSNTAQSLDNGANALTKARQKVNEQMTGVLADQKANALREYENSQRQSSLSAKYQKQPKGEKGGGNVEKTGFDDYLKSLDKVIQYADKQAKRLEDIEKEKLESMLISTADYYNKEAEIINNQFAVHEKALNEKLRATEEYIKKTKGAERKKNEDKAEAIRDKIEDDNEVKKDTLRKLEIQRERALSEVVKKNNDYKIQYLTLMGNVAEAQKLAVNQKYDELAKSKDITDELKQQLEIMRNIELKQSSINDDKRKYEALSNQISLAEKSAQLLMDSGKIGEIDYLATIRDLRLRNSKEAIESLRNQYNEQLNIYKELENAGASATSKLEVANKMQELSNSIQEIQNNLDPLAKKFDDIMGNSINKTLEEIATTGRITQDTIANIFKSIEQDITSLISKNLSTQLMKSLFGDAGNGTTGAGSFFSNLFGGSSSGSSGGGIGSFISSLFSGMFADGGNVLPSDKPILVGERGPEIWQPSGSGRIINNNDASRLSGGNGSNLTINVHGVTDASSFKASEGQIGAEIMRKLSRANKRNN